VKGLALYEALAALLLPARAQFRLSRRRNARGFAQYQGSKRKARLMRRGLLTWANRHGRAA